MFNRDLLKLHLAREMGFSVITISPEANCSGEDFSKSLVKSIDSREELSLSEEIPDELSITDID